jgi:hypothetical protein
MTTLAEALAPKSDQLNADDLIPGPRTIMITSAKIVKSERQMRITLGYEGDNGKPFKPCKTMGRAMVLVWAIPDEGYEQHFIGKSIRVYRDPDVKFGDQGAVGGIRISHMSHIDKAAHVKLTVSQGQKREFVFQPLPKLAEQSGGQRPNTGLSPAAQFARDHIEGVQNAETVEVLDQIIAEDAKGLNRLKGDEPQLFADCEIAAATRRAQLEEPGPDVSQSGESTGGYGDDDAPATGFGDIYLRAKGSIRMAKNVAYLDAAMDAFDKRASEGTDEQVAEIRGLAATKRASLN